MGARRNGTFARMGSERGQATVEWIGILLVVAIALAAVARLAERDDHRGLPIALAHAVTCAARDGCRHAQVVGIRSEKRTESQPLRSEAFIAPPLVPSPNVMRPGPLLGPPRTAQRGRLRDGAGRAWRSAWFACLVYERLRWAILHPESRSHRYEFPPSEALRILNDCISPLDLVRDWPLLTTR
jgi:hypothetical protein